MKDLFHKISTRVSVGVGTPYAFILALSVVFVWGMTGPIFGFSDTWQLVINTGTTIITFLMVFLIQNTQNRDSKAMHLKLDELIVGTAGTRNSFVDLDDLSDDELKALEEDFKALHQKHGNAATKALTERLAEAAAQRRGIFLSGVESVIRRVTRR